MKSPPRVTLIGPANPATTLPNGVLLSHTNSVFRYSGARSETWGDTYPKGYFTVAGGITGVYAQIPFKIEFEIDAQEFEFLTLGTGARYRLKIDGDYVELDERVSPQPDGNFYWVKLEFDSKRRRGVAIEANGLAFGGVALNSEDRAYYPETSLGPRCIVLGDSFTEGLLSFAQRLSGLTGWEIWGSGVGGIGYMNPGPPGRVQFIARVESDVIRNYPDIVVIAGGINDAAYPPDALRTQAQALYDTLLTNLPSAKLVVLGPWWPRGVPPQFVLDTRDALKDAALSRGLEFIDPIVATNTTQKNVGWITGTGYTGNPQGDGNADLYISSDHTHPTDLGHQYLALRLAERLRAVQVVDPTPRIEILSPQRFRIHGSIGRRYLLQFKPGLKDAEWVNGSTLSLSSNPQTWFDVNTAGLQNRFYRALLLP